MLKELFGQDRADQVQAMVLRTGVAASVAVKAGEGSGGAGFEIGAKNVFRGHGEGYVRARETALTRMKTKLPVMVTRSKPKPTRMTRAAGWLAKWHVGRLAGRPVAW